jgi:DNA invertase Pin-like site-specific DNA recombinase
MAKKAMETAAASGRIIGYARVSTDAQDTDRQVRDIIAYTKKTGAGAPQIVTETASGAKDRPELMATIDGLMPGDTLIVTEFSRLTRRGIPELLEIARKVTGKGAALVEIRSSTRYDDTAMGELLISVTATFDRMERERIGERTKSALQARKAAGMKLGRPTGLGVKVPEAAKAAGVSIADIDRMLGVGTSAAAVARLLNIDARTVLRWMRTREGRG